MSASLKNTIKALLNVEAIFMTDLHCQLFNALCFVYLPLRNQQFVKYHQDIFLKVVIPSDGFAYILVLKKKKRKKYDSVFICNNALEIVSCVLKPMKPTHRISTSGLSCLQIWPLQISRKCVGNEYQGCNTNFTDGKASFTPPLSRRLAFASLWKNNV